MFEKDDIITCESYKPLCDYIYQPGMEPVGGLVHVNMEELPYFLEAIKGRNDRYVVVSSCSDFGMVYQAENPVWVDAPKWARMMANPEIGYNSMVVHPRCALDKCNIEDRYSVKCYAWTAFTFPEIPPNIVRWFTTNFSLYEDERVTAIPFGIAANGKEVLWNKMQESKGEPHSVETKVYINWVNYTIERAEILEFFKRLNQPDDYVIIDTPKPYEEYLDDLKKYAFVFSPAGNGLDCYRTWESIYLGAIPILDLNYNSYSLVPNIPAVITKNFLGVNPRQIANITLQADNILANKAKLSYWKQEFEQAKSML